MNPWIIIGIVSVAVLLTLAFCGALIASFIGTAGAPTVGILLGCLIGSGIVTGIIFGEVLR